MVSSSTKVRRRLESHLTRLAKIVTRGPAKKSQTRVNLSEGTPQASG